jgi:hypothetical protein
MRPKNLSYEPDFSVAESSQVAKAETRDLLT